MSSRRCITESFAAVSGCISCRERAVRAESAVSFFTLRLSSGTPTRLASLFWAATSRANNKKRATQTHWKMRQCQAEKGPACLFSCVRQCSFTCRVELFFDVSIVIISDCWYGLLNLRHAKLAKNPLSTKPLLQKDSGCEQANCLPTLGTRHFFTKKVHCKTHFNI